MKTFAKTDGTALGAFDTPRKIYEHLERFVVGQERAKKAVAVAAHNHCKRLAAVANGRSSRLLRKSNVLLVGPTGSGKTHIARHLADALGVPFTVVDATEYTEAGYYGKDVEVMIAELLFKANHSIEDTQRGIVFIDEIDKVARRSHGARTGAGSRDIGGEGVQQALLKILEGREIFVPLNVTQHWNKHDFVQVNTTNILFICAGTFSDLHDDGAREVARRPVGFGGALGAARKRRIRHKDLLEYGMIAEFLGRLPVMVELDALGPAELKRILTEPPDALVREYRELLALDGVALELADDALDALAEHAIARGYGARGLRGVFEEVLREVLFDAPSHRGEIITLSAESVRAHLAACERDD